MGDNVCVGRAVGVSVGRAVGVFVWVLVGVSVGVNVELGFTVLVFVGVCVGESVGEGEIVGVNSGTFSVLMAIESLRSFTDGIGCSFGPHAARMQTMTSNKYCFFIGPLI